MDPKVVVEVLKHTYNMDNAARKAAEAKLAELEAVSGFPSCMLQVITMDLPLEIRQAAIIRLKNIVKEHWDISDGEANRISEADRKLIKDNLLEAIVHQPQHLIRVQLLECLYLISRTDFPEQWPQLLPNIAAHLQHKEEARVKAGVSALRCLFKKYQFKSSDDRALATDLVSICFPFLQVLFASALKNPTTPSAMEMMRELCRIFQLATDLSIPSYLANEANFGTWMTMLLAVWKLPTPAAFEAKNKDEADEAEKSDFWRAKAYVANAFTRTFTRFGRPKQVSKDGKAFANMFFDKFALGCLGAFMEMLKRRKEGHFVTSRVMQQCYHYIDTAIPLTAMFKVMKPHLHFLLFDCILHTLCLTPHDLEIWKSDPHEFVRREQDVMEQFHDPRLTAMNALTAFIKVRTSATLSLTLNALSGIFTTYAQADNANKNYIMKEGAMRMFGGLRKLLLSEKKYHGPVEAILANHIFPEFKNPLGFMRARANWVVGRYSRLNYAQESNHAQAVVLTIQSLTDVDLPVKLEAAIALSRLVDVDVDEDGTSKIVKFVKPHLNTIIEQLFTLFDEIGNETVMRTLGEIIHQFGAEIQPYADALCGRLIDTFMELFQADPEDDEAALTAQQTLVACNAILHAVSDIKELFPALEQKCLPLMSALFHERGIEFFDDTLQMLSSFTYFPAKISDALWAFVPRMSEAFHMWAADYISEMMAPLDNFVSREPERFLQPQYLQPVLKICTTLIEDPKREVDCQFAAKIMETILAHCKGKMDHLLGDFIKIAAQKLFVAKKVNLRLLFADVIGGCAYYNPLLFCQHVRTLGEEFAQQLFNHWFSFIPSMKTSLKHMKLALLGMSSLLMVPMAALPPSIATKFPVLMEQILLLLQQSHERYEHEAKKAAEESDDEDEEGFDDVNEDEDANDDGEQDVETFAHDVAEHLKNVGEGDEENYISPIDNVDEFDFWSTSFQAWTKKEPAVYQAWSAQLSAEVKAKVQGFIQEAAKRKELIEKEKEEEDD